MEINPIRESIESLPPVEQKSSIVEEFGSVDDRIHQLSSNHLQEFGQNFHGEIYHPIGNTLSLPSELRIERGVLSDISKVEEKYLEVQSHRLIEGIRRGELNFTDLHGDLLPFSEKMTLLLNESSRNIDGSCELLIKGIPTVKGETTGELRMVIKEDRILSSDGQVMSQIKDKTYQDKLLSHSQQKHYSFQFFDVGRNGEIQEKLEELREEKKSIDDLGELLNAFFIDYNVDEFNRNLTPTQREMLEIPSNQILSEDDIIALYEKYQDVAFMQPIKEESIKTELAKATISGRFCEDGSIGELKSINIHSKELGGSQLMSFWDGFCRFMSPSEVYLEDDAKIEGKTGSYNLRMFRLATLPDKASWYVDSFGYQSYQQTEGAMSHDANPSGIAQNNIAIFKNMSVNQAFQLLRTEGVKVNSDVLVLLEKYMRDPACGGEIDIGSLVKHIGDKVKEGENLHKEIDLIFSAVHAFAQYEGDELNLLQLKHQAEVVIEDRFYRKNYSA